MPAHRPEVIDAMQAIFDLAIAIEKDVTIGELEDVMRDAISDGHDMLAIALSMASIALNRTNPQTHGVSI